MPTPSNRVKQERMLIEQRLRDTARAAYVRETGRALHKPTNNIREVPNPARIYNRPDYESNHAQAKV